MPALLKTNETSFRSAMSSRLKLRTGATLRGEVHVPANMEGAVASCDAARRKDSAMDAATESKSPASFPKTTTRCCCCCCSASALRQDACLKNCCRAEVPDIARGAGGGFTDKGERCASAQQGNQNGLFLR